MSTEFETRLTEQVKNDSPKGAIISSPTPQTFNVSVCKHYNDALPKADNNYEVKDGWVLKTFKWTAEDLLKISTTMGVSMNEFHEGNRNNDSWKGVHGIMMDFDDGRMTIDMVEEAQERMQFNSYMFSSQNHAVDKVKKDKKGNVKKIEPPCDRLRVLIPFSEPIRNPIELLFIKDIILNYYPTIDASFAGQARYFAHGGKDPKTRVSNFSNKGNFLDWRLYLEQNGKKVKDDYASISKGKTRGRPKQDAPDPDTVPTFSMETKVWQGAPGKEVELTIRQIDEKYKKNPKKAQSIFCPICGHGVHRSNATMNAGYLYNSNGIPFIICLSCQARDTGIGGHGVYNLDKDEAHMLDSKRLNVLIFRDKLTDKYFLGEVSKRTNAFEFNVIGKQNIKNALTLRKMSVPEVIPEAEHVFDFQSDRIDEWDKGFINKYILPDILKKTPEDKEYKIPETIRKLTLHICGHVEGENIKENIVFERLIHHLAHMVQTREKLRITFLFQGIQGTGKGIWFNHVLAPIFGRSYCTTLLQKAFLKEFNTVLESNYCILLDEVEADFSDKGSELARVLKHIITEKHISIEGKGVDRRNGQNNANLFLATNKSFGVKIEPGDRRFIIAKRQEEKVYAKKWWTSDDSIKGQLGNEVEEFVMYLKKFKVKKVLLNRIVENDARKQLIEYSKTYTEQFFDAVREGDFNWLQDKIQRVRTYVGENDYEAVKKIISTLRRSSKVTRDDLLELFNNITGKSVTKDSFSRKCNENGIEIKPIRIGKDVPQGTRIFWSREILMDYKKELEEDKYNNKPVITELNKQLKLM